ncbi:MAG: hypothetical protein NTX88_04875, partial [Candidatus Atribacteria bacterium]|nr:hypothetical protein [Candidatus Atribacteria bacterium]
VLHAGKMEQLFEVEFLEETHPYTFRPFFLPLGKKKVSPDKSLTVHLVCGGGSGYPFIREFLEGGMMVSVGIVNQLDSDEELATKLGLTVVREKPFSPFSDSTVQNALAVSREADFIVIAPVFWGWGNLKNLELAQNLLREGKKVLLLQESLDPKLDYTEGTAIQLLQQLIQEGAQVFLDLPALITHLL